MKGRDQFKDLLQRYHVSDGKEEDIVRTIQIGQNVVGRMIPSNIAFSVLLKCQAKYISPYLWVTQFITIVMTIVLTINLINPYIEIPRILFTLSPILAFFAVPELIKSMIYDMAELEHTCKYSMPKILVARLLIIGGVNIVALTIMIAFLSIQYQMPFIQLILYGLVPINIVNGINLLVLTFLNIRSTIKLTGISFCLVALMMMFTELRIFVAITETMWIIISIVSTIFLLAELYYFIKNVTREVLIQWN
ncbi:MAG: hypothetical protein GX815_14060 [Clostridiales bacterium]|nr:hypothetical protein [Clostridiales bacterium]